MFRHFSVSFFPLVVTLAAFVVMCKLGFWQLERAEQKQQQIMIFSQQGELNSESLVNVTSSQYPELNGRKVNLQGTIIKDQVWLLDNKTYQGKVGYSVLTTLKLTATDLQILVNWGWIQASKYRSELPDIHLPAQISLTGIMRTTDFEQFSLQKNQLEAGWPKRVQSISSVLTSLESSSVLPIVVYADTQDSINYPQTYKPVVMPPEKHQAYAVQWFLLALASVVVFMLASYKSGKRIKQTSNL